LKDKIDENILHPTCAIRLICWKTTWRSTLLYCVLLTI